MELHGSTIERIGRIPWLAKCGEELPGELAGFRAAQSEEFALEAFRSELWMDVKTEAQGDLTDFLSKHHASSYGGAWNLLAETAMKTVDSLVRHPLSKALVYREWPENTADSIVVDLARALLEASYLAKFARVPLFFDKLLIVYETGHIACGWEGSISRWPSGFIIAY